MGRKEYGNMDATYYIDASQRTIIQATAGYDVGEQRIRIYAPNGAVFDLYNGYPNFGTVSFAIEDRADQFINPYPNSTTGKVTVALERRYQVLGNYTSWTEREKYEISYPINRNQWTAPTIDAVSFAPSITLLGEANLYVKTKNGVRVSSISADAKLGASLKSVEWYIDGTDEINHVVGETSSNFKTFGQVPITFKATDSRGFTVTRTEVATVIDYFKPYISPVTDGERVIVARVDSNGNIVDGGKTLRIEAGRRYSSVGGRNRCRLLYRIRGNDSDWSEFKDLLPINAAENDYTANLDALDEHMVYYVELAVVDSLEESEVFLETLSTEEVFMYKSGTKKSIAFGGHVTEKNAFQCFWRAYFYNDVVVNSSTDGSTKQFAISVDDNGNITAKEIN